MPLTQDNIERIVFARQSMRNTEFNIVLLPDVQAAVTAAISRMARVAEFPYEQWDPPPFNTVQGKANYKVHGDVARILRLNLTKTNGAKIKLASVTDLRFDELRWTGGNEPEEQPTEWTVWQQEIWLNPVPNQAYPINYPSERVTASVDSIPHQFRDILIDGAMAFFDAKHMPVFMLGVDQAKKYMRSMKGRRREWKADRAVEAEHRRQEIRNVY